MQRIDLPEIEDQPWCPVLLRDAMTGYLQVVIEKARPYDLAAPVLASLLESTGSTEVVDIASGAGGPWRRLLPAARELGASPTVTLTDLTPNHTAAAQIETESGLSYHPHSVSALDVPAELKGVRTMFTALHHFDRAEVERILRSAQEAGVGFAGFEVTHRSWRGVLVSLFIPLLVLVLMPLAKPRRVSVLLFTYLVPILPLMIWWDGTASTLRTHSATELRAIIEDIAEPGYSWTIEEVPVSGAPIPVLQIVGRPEAA